MQNPQTRPRSDRSGHGHRALSIALIIGMFAAFGCGGGDNPNPQVDPATGRNWDQMNWDQGRWG